MEVQVIVTLVPLMTGVSSCNLGATTTLKAPVELRLGEPLSVTRNLTVLVEEFCASVGVQLICPALLTVNPAGPETRANVKELMGISGSVAVALTDKLLPGWRVVSLGTVRTGAEFTSLTIKVKL